MIRLIHKNDLLIELDALCEVYHNLQDYVLTHQESEIVAIVNDRADNSVYDIKGTAELVVRALYNHHASNENTHAFIADVETLLWSFTD